MITLTRTTLEIDGPGFYALPSFQDTQDWLTAHGIVPGDMPLGPPIVRGRRSITYTRYLRNEQGKRYLDPDDPKTMAVEEVTLQLVRRPAPWPRSLRRDAKRWGA
jgi:hypothetical protein